MSRSRKYPYQQEAPRPFRRLQHKQLRAHERSRGTETDPKAFGRQLWQDDMDYTGTDAEAKARRK